MNLFGQLLEIKTWTEKVEVKSIGLKAKNEDLKWTDFEYFYDIKNSSIYINWLDKNDIGFEVLEEAINKIFFIHNPKKEMTSFLGNLMNPTHKKPKVFYFTYSQNWDSVLINKLQINCVRNSNLEIKELKINGLNYSS